MIVNCCGEPLSIFHWWNVIGRDVAGAVDRANGELMLPLLVVAAAYVSGELQAWNAPFSRLHS